MTSSVRILVHLFGWPHEGLHALALLLIGRRALRVTETHVDVPRDLTDGQYLFVAGLPAAVFWGATALALLGLLDAATLGQAALALLAALVLGVGGVSTLGDLHLIVLRLLTRRDGTEE